MSTCKSCLKPIVWVRGYRGPCDPTPVQVVPMPGNGPSSYVVAGVGVVQARRAEGAEVGRPAFVSHFSTCVHAVRHRRPRVEPKAAPAPAPPPTRDLFPTSSSYRPDGDR